VVGEGFCDGQSPTFTVTLGEALHPLFGYVTCVLVEEVWLGCGGSFFKFGFFSISSLIFYLI